MFAVNDSHIPLQLLLNEGDHLIYIVLVQVGFFWSRVKVNSLPWSRSRR
jgi:hypothetical protein